MIATKMTTSDEQLLHQLMQDVITALNNKDIETLLALHTDDIILMDPGMPAIQGKEKIKALFADFKRKKVDLKLQFEIYESEVIQHRAFVRGMVARQMVNKQGDMVMEKGKFICICRKEPNGSWLRTHVIANMDEPVI